MRYARICLTKKETAFGIIQYLFFYQFQFVFRSRNERETPIQPMNQLTQRTLFCFVAPQVQMGYYVEFEEKSEPSIEIIGDFTFNAEYIRKDK